MGPVTQLNWYGFWQSDSNTNKIHYYEKSMEISHPDLICCPRGGNCIIRKCTDEL